jgi:hypothetical protein
MFSRTTPNLDIPTLNDPFSDTSPTSPTITPTEGDPANIPLPETPTSPADVQLPSPSTPQGYTSDTNAPTTSKILSKIDRYGVRWS